MDDGHECASKADLAPSATKSNPAALELRLVREMNARHWRPIGALAGVAGIAAGVSHRP